MSKRKKQEFEDILFYHKELQPGYHWLYVPKPYLSAIITALVNFCEYEVVKLGFAFKFIIPFIRLVLQLKKFKEYHGNDHIVDIVVLNGSQKQIINNCYLFQTNDWCKRQIIRALQVDKKLFQAGLIEELSQKPYIESYVPTTQTNIQSKHIQEPSIFAQD